MVKEVMENLAVKPAGVYWDGTFGGGGHAKVLLDALSEQGRLLASDWDGDAVERAGSLLSDTRFEFVRASLLDALDHIPTRLDGFLWDLGLSMFQIREESRGFSFRQSGPLDMRMDQSRGETAADLVNRLEETELANLIYRYGEERLSRRIAHGIVMRRGEHPITETQELADICRRAYPRKWHRIDPATRTFQALRVAVNGELRQIEDCLPLALERLAPGGRAVVISFQSQEDRIVKHCFKDHARVGGFCVITKRPLVASEEERDENPASRSAKLRVIEALAD